MTEPEYNSPVFWSSIQREAIRLAFVRGHEMSMTICKNVLLCKKKEEASEKTTAVGYVNHRSRPCETLRVSRMLR